MYTIVLYVPYLPSTFTGIVYINVSTAYCQLEIRVGNVIHEEVWKICHPFDHAINFYLQKKYRILYYITL